MIGYLQPGMGLGLTASRQIAFGLGVIVIIAKSKQRILYGDFDIQAALKDDKDLTDILIMIIDTGILD